MSAFSIRVDQPWYGHGQDDVLTWLKGAPTDDAPLAPICDEFQTEYSLWCVGHNISLAAALKLAHERGWWDGAGYHRRNP